jgi:hypothetical protein
MSHLLVAVCPQSCQLSVAKGSFWQGKGDLSLRPNAQAAWVRAGQLGWDWSPSGLNLALDGGHLNLSPAWNGLSLQGGGLSVAAASILLLIPDLPRSTWQGRLQLLDLNAHLPWGILQGGSPEKIAGTLCWEGAASGMLPGMILGDYRLRLDGQPTTGHLQLSTDTGLLNLTGSAQLEGKNWRGQIETKVEEPASQRQLDPLLRTLGQAINGEAGRYRIVF